MGTVFFLTFVNYQTSLKRKYLKFFRSPMITTIFHSIQNIFICRKYNKLPYNKLRYILLLTIIRSLCQIPKHPKSATMSKRKASKIEIVELAMSKRKASKIEIVELASFISGIKLPSNGQAVGRMIFRVKKNCIT